MPPPIDHLELREWRDTDVDAVAAAFAAPDMDRQWRHPVRTRDEAAGWLEWAASLTNRACGFAFAICGDGTPIGNVAVTNINPHDCGWISYWTAQPARGNGVASDALRGLLPWLHDDLGLHRLELGYRANNPGSGRVAANAGFSLEGLQREKLCYDGKRYDVQRCARLTGDPRPRPARAVRLPRALLRLVVGVDDDRVQRHPQT